MREPIFIDFSKPLLHTPSLMKTLPTQFRKNGFDYTQIDREGLVAVYKQTKGESVHFEVGRIRENKARVQFGLNLEASESWPSSEEWGVRAWTCMDLRRARQRMDTLIPPNAAES